MYIWACPPLQGDDYIMYCHPGRQKTPRSDRLREWYHAMLRRARAEGTVRHVATLHDSFFPGGAGHRVERPSVRQLPYFEGDYWPGEAENLLAQAAGAKGAKGGSQGCGSGTASGKDGLDLAKGAGNKRAWGGGGPLDEQLLVRLGDTMQGQGVRPDLIVVHLQEPCSHCRKYIAGEHRHYHPSPPQRVVIKAERVFDGITLDRPGGEGARTVALTHFQLCQGCRDREAGMAPHGVKVRAFVLGFFGYGLGSSSS
jgi:E1A/CREB-binding protein